MASDLIILEFKNPKTKTLIGREMYGGKILDLIVSKEEASLPENQEKYTFQQIANRTANSIETRFGSNYRDLLGKPVEVKFYKQGQEEPPLFHTAMVLKKM